MTTTSDWQFRAAYFAMKAEVADRRADELRQEAVRLRDLARKAKDVADWNGPVERTNNKYGTYGE